MEKTVCLGRGMKILFVEDDPLSRDLLSTMLAIGFPESELLTAENGEDGLKLYLEQNPDLVLSDIHMPHVDGIAMAEKIKEMRPEAVIIIISAHSDTRHLIKAIELGITRYILKPVDKQKLFTTMESAMAGLTMERQLKEHQKQLRESRELLYSIVESNCDVVFIKDLEGRYLQVNPATTVATGKSADEIIGHDDYALFPHETAEIFRRNDSLVINSGNLMNFEESIADKNGETLFFLTTRGPLHDDQGNITSTFGVARNVTEQKRYEKHIERHNAALEERVKERTWDLEQSNREMEAFCHAISHELRAPIARLEGFHQAVAECLEAQDVQDIPYYLERLGFSTQQLKAAVDALLMMYRLTRADISPEPVNLTYLSQQVMIDLMDEYGSRTIHFDNRPETIVRGDRKLLTLCMHNLLGNALKYSSKKPESLISIGLEEREGEPVYFVRDNGAGFDMAYADNLFKPFSRLHHPSEFEGTGIGLATVQRIIEKHQGRIWADSRLDEGTTIYFTLGL
ncbi:response regulator [Geotalea sp. SG265]|uniref:sensor histidine kinase n=1 Tax=Geotalea sp. SG265 TaxID=2922867 RepID=UPI001FAE9838|nr:response regulator [Geotalea sp. SG265]